MGTNNAQLNTAPNVNGAEIYGLRAKMLTGVQQSPVSIIASGGMGENGVGSTHPAFSWVSLVVLLVGIRVLEAMLPES